MREDVCKCFVILGVCEDFLALAATVIYVIKMTFLKVSLGVFAGHNYS